MTTAVEVELKRRAGAAKIDMMSYGWGRSLFGLDVVVSPDIPRYVLPAEVMPGVPWPAGFRDDINQWSLSFLGTLNVVPAGVCYVVGNSVVMRPADVVKISGLDL
jgi:hypothetical protein